MAVGLTRQAGNIDLINGPINRTLLRLAAPNVAATLILSCLSVIEAIYLGRLGAIALAGVALVFPLFMLANMLSSGAIGGAVSGATARAIGTGDNQQAEAVLRSSLCVALAGGLSMTALVLWLGPSLYRLLGGFDDVLQAALRYSNTLFGLITVIWIHNMIASVLRGSGDMIRPAQSTLLIVLSHALLAWVFVFGFGPVPALGLTGAALAIVVAYGLGVVYLLHHLLHSHSRVRLRPGRIPWSALRPILGNGLLASNQSVMTVSLALLCTSLIGQFGTQWMAGYGIGIRLELLLTPIIFGIGGALIAMIGANVGAGKRAQAIRVAWRGVFFCMLTVGAIGLVLAINPHWWSGRFTSEIEISQICNDYLSVVGPAYAFFALGLCLYFASQGLESLLLPVIGTAVRLLIVAIGAFFLHRLDAFETLNLFRLFAFAMLVYGVFIAGSLYFGPWSQRKTSQ